MDDQNLILPRFSEGELTKSIGDPNCLGRRSRGKLRLTGRSCPVQSYKQVARFVSNHVSPHNRGGPRRCLRIDGTGQIGDRFGEQEHIRSCKRGLEELTAGFARHLGRSVAVGSKTWIGVPEMDGLLFQDFQGGKAMKISTRNARPRRS